ncbi:Scr1 family TA system antitoxin-like transcriptional regulator [Micromonospora sp. PSH25]|nr:Scr1 family TA system antitoxin-like transcriptional regulator [Micromonospora foliorum]MCG5437036.1 Scr1 family TA system antitoxin-like transcriptional regulator [Micromonospora foliorum]
MRVLADVRGWVDDRAAEWSLFNLARGADGGWVGQMEHQIDGLVVDGEHEVATLLARWEMIRNGALSRRQSIDLMKEVVTSWT